MTGWTKVWAAWAIAAGVTFWEIERRALKVQHASLSEHLRTAFGFDDTPPLPAVRRSLFYAAWGWFALHIARKSAGCVSRIVESIPTS